MTEEADSLLTVQEAAKEARISTSSIYEACERKVLTHHRLSGSRKRGKIVIWRSDLLSWIESCRVAAEATPPPTLRAASAAPASPFSELDPSRLAKAWKKS